MPRGRSDERTEPAAVRPRRKMKALPRDGVGFHKRAVRRARDSEERAVDDGRGFGLGESGTDANGARRRSPAQEAIMMITVSYIRTS